MKDARETHQCYCSTRGIAEDKAIRLIRQGFEVVEVLGVFDWENDDQLRYRVTATRSTREGK